MKIGFALFATHLLAYSLHAQLPLTWVSGIGDDLNPGSRISPGKTFAGMIHKTDPGGQISVLDPGSFGGFTITRSLTIDGNSEPAEIIASSPLNPVITINANTDDIVILRDLTINGNNLAAIAIQFNSGRQLIIENCHIVGFITTGININAAAGANIVIRNTSISNVPTGVRVNGSGSINVALCNISIQKTTVAAVHAFIGKVVVANSLITENSGTAVKAEGTGIISCSNSLFASNNIAIQALTGAAIRISNNEFYNNSTGIDNSAGGIVATANNNREAGSTVPGLPTTSIISQ